MRSRFTHPTRDRVALRRALGPALATRTGMLENPESCAAIQRSFAARDDEVRERFDPLAQGGRCR